MVEAKPSGRSSAIPPRRSCLSRRPGYPPTGAVLHPHRPGRRCSPQHALAPCRGSRKHADHRRDRRCGTTGRRDRRSASAHLNETDRGSRRSFGRATPSLRAPHRWPRFAARFRRRVEFLPLAMRFAPRCLDIGRKQLDEAFETEPARLRLELWVHDQCLSRREPCP